MFVGRSVEEQRSGGKEGLLECGRDGEEEEHVDGVGDGEGGDDGFGGCGLQAEGRGERVEFCVVLRVLSDAVVVAT